MKNEYSEQFLTHFVPLTEIWVVLKKVLSGDLKKIHLCNKFSFPLETPFHNYTCLSFLIKNRRITKNAI